MKASRWVHAAVLATALLLAGCSGDGAKETRSAPAKVPNGVSAQEGSAPGRSLPPVTGRSLPPVAARTVVYSADLQVRNKDVTGTTARAKRIVLAAGGYVGSENAVTAPDEPASSTITFKVPSARYAGVLDQLGSTLGHRISLRQQANDVAQQVADVDSRVRSAKAALASFRSLLGKAGTVSEIIRVEQEISQRESELESLQAQQKSLAQQTAYATVTLRLNGVAPTRHKKADGFTGGVSAGWHAFTAFLGRLAMVVGWLLPFAGAAALIVLPLWYLRRRRRRSATT